MRGWRFVISIEVGGWMAIRIYLRPNLLHTGNSCWYITSSFASLEELRDDQCSSHRRRTFVSFLQASKSVPRPTSKHADMSISDGRR